MSLAVTERSFEHEVLKSERPVLVDFWAPWCGPCEKFTPVVERVAAERGEAVKLVTVNIDEERALARRYDVKSIPTVIQFERGAPVARSVGAVPRWLLELQLELPSKRRSAEHRSPSDRGPSVFDRLRRRRTEPASSPEPGETID